MARYGSTAVMDADRDAATAQLREHYAVGRLSLDQFQDRLDEAYRAQTVRELGAATDGLPHVGQVIPSGAPRGSYPGGILQRVADRSGEAVHEARNRRAFLRHGYKHLAGHAVLVHAHRDVTFVACD